MENRKDELVLDFNVERSGNEQTGDGDLTSQSWKMEDGSWPTVNGASEMHHNPPW